VNIPSYAEFLAIAVAFAGVSPVLTALVLQWHWPSWAKTAIGLLLALALALVGTMVLFPDWPTGVAEWITFLVAVVAATQASYRSLWQPAKIERVEEKTSISKPPGTRSAGK
jgi:hypothetical protein